MLKNMKISKSHTVRSERTCRLPSCFIDILHRPSGLHLMVNWSSVFCAVTGLSFFVSVPLMAFISVTYTALVTIIVSFYLVCYIISIVKQRPFTDPQRKNPQTTKIVIIGHNSVAVAHVCIKCNRDTDRKRVSGSSFAVKIHIRHNPRWWLPPFGNSHYRL